MKKIILLVMVVYAVLAPLTYHPDTKLTLYYATLGKEKVWDIYSYLAINKDHAPDFHYPPMNFWLLKAELPLAKLAGGKGLVEWLGSNGNEAFLSQRIFIYNLAVKIPLLILVLLSGFLIKKIMIKNGKSEKIANRGMLIWFLNPITLYSAVIMGQNDILAIFPFLIGLLFFYDRPVLAFLFFGLSGSVKSYPLIWSLMLAFSYPKASFVKKVLLALIPMGLYLIPMLPFLKYDYFKQSVIYSGLSVRMFEGAIDIGFGDKLLIVPMLLVSLMLVGVRSKLTTKLTGTCLLLMTATLLILGFTHFHPQWFIWIMPFVAIFMADKNDWWWWVLTIVALIGIICLFDDKYLYWGLWSPLNPGLVNLPFLSEILEGKGVDVRLLNNLCHSIIAGVGLYWFLESIQNKNE